MDVQDAVRQHYRRHWGAPSREAEFSTRNESVEVYKWDASKNPEGVTMYATLGASVADMPGTTAGHRVEYVVGLEPSLDAVARELAGLALFARQEDVTVDHGHSVPADGSLWPGSPMSTFLVLRPLVVIVPPLQLSGDVHVEFLQAVPIYESERRFKSRYGAEALLERWEDARVRFWDPHRTPEPAS